MQNEGGRYPAQGASWEFSVSPSPGGRQLRSDCVLTLCLEHQASVRGPSGHRDSPGLSPGAPQRQELVPGTCPPLGKDAPAVF